MRNRAALVTLILLVGACAASTSDTTTTTATTTTTPTTTTTTTTTTSTTTTTTVLPVEIPPAIDWENHNNPASVGVGWAVARCDGDAPLLCIARDGGIVGVVEWSIADPHTYDVYDTSANDEVNLRAMAAAFVEGFSVDRASECGTGYVVDPIEPEPIDLWGATGLVHGFRGTMSDGAPSELHLQYRVFSEGRLILLSASAYDVGGCPGRSGLVSFDSAGLEAFRPHLELLLTLSPRPGADAGTG